MANNIITERYKQEYRVDYSIQYEWIIDANYCHNILNKLRANIDKSKEILMVGINLDKTIWTPHVIPEAVKKIEMVTNPTLSINITDDNCNLRLLKR